MEMGTRGKWSSRRQGKKACIFLNGGSNVYVVTDMWLLVDRVVSVYEIVVYGDVV